MSPVDADTLSVFVTVDVFAFVTLYVVAAKTGDAANKTAVAAAATCAAFMSRNFISCIRCCT